MPMEYTRPRDIGKYDVTRNTLAKVHDNDVWSDDLDHARDRDSGSII